MSERRLSDRLSGRLSDPFSDLSSEIPSISGTPPQATGQEAKRAWEIGADQETDRETERSRISSAAHSLLLPLFPVKSAPAFTSLSQKGQCVEGVEGVEGVGGGYFSCENRSDKIYIISLYFFSCLLLFV